MANNDFNAVSFLLRWLFALILVLGTYNPTGYCYSHWVITGIDDWRQTKADSDAAPGDIRRCGCITTAHADH